MVGKAPDVVDKGYMVRIVHVKWERRLPLDVGINSFPAQSWHGLYYITNRFDIPVYIGISDAETNTIANRLISHRDNKLPDNGAPYYVRIGQIIDRYPQDAYHRLLLVVEAACITYFKKKCRYNMLQRNTHSKNSAFIYVLIENSGDYGELPRRFNSNLQNEY